MSESIFQFVGRGMPAASARGVHCTYKPFVGGKVIVMMDGADRDLTRPGTRKYTYSIRGGDLWCPPFAGLWIGQQILADLPAEFIEPVSQPQERPEVPGSLFYIDASKSAVVAAGDPAAAWRVYNPRSFISILGWEVEEDEDGAAVSWSIDLRDVRFGGGQ